MSPTQLPVSTAVPDSEPWQTPVTGMKLSTVQGAATVYVSGGFAKCALTGILRELCPALAVPAVIPAATNAVSPIAVMRRPRRLFLVCMVVPSWLCFVIIRDVAGGSVAIGS